MLKQLNRSTWLAVFVAAGMFVPLFITRGAGGFDFWWWMSTNLAALLALSAHLDFSWRDRLIKDLRTGLGFKIGMGIFSAALLYAIFYIGNIGARLLLPFAGSGIGDVYTFKDQASPLRIVLLMVLLIGPGEELFWRHFLQRHFQTIYGAGRGLILATAAYTLIHLGSGNIMLVLAAGVCGAFWSLLYWRYRSPVMNAISHTLWDVAVFILFPLG